MREKSSIDHLILNVFLKNVHPDSKVPRYIWSHISQRPRNLFKFPGLSCIDESYLFDEIHIH